MHTMTDRPEPLTAALRYAARGWSVLPLYSIVNGRCTCGKSNCISPGKHPRTEHGGKEATTDTEQLRAWWKRWPDANIGIATGLISGFVAIDVDPRNNGHLNLAELEQQYGSLPPTPEAQTGGGGRHILLAYPDGTPAWKKALTDGVDIKADGGYIVAPPSGHASGQRYEWDVLCHPDDTEIAECPSWVLDLLRKPQDGTRGAPTVVDAITSGQRNNTLVSLAGSMRRRGLTTEEILPGLQAVNARRCKPPLDDSEVRKIAESVERYTPAAEQKAAAIGSGKAIMVCLADIAPEPVSYLWHPYIPVGKLTLMEGDPGGGKTWLALAIAAATTTGCRFPTEDGKPGQWREAASVIYISAEDGLADTLRPRLDAVGADVSKVFAITGAVDDEGKSVQWTMEKITELEVAIIQTSAKLIIIDPVQAFLGAAVDMHRANEVRPKLAAIAALAERQRCAVVIIRHLAKAGAAKAIYRGMGSIDFTAAARSVLLVGPDSQNKEHRALVHIKSSLALAGPAQRYELTSEGFRWAGISNLTAADVLGMESTKEDRSALEDAVEWLRDFLADGPKEFPVIDKAARRQDIKSRTLKRAKDELRTREQLDTYKKPGVFNGPWIWEFKHEEDHNHEEGQDPPKGLVGPLRNIQETHIYQGFEGGKEVDPLAHFGT